MSSTRAFHILTAPALSRFRALAQTAGLAATLLVSGCGFQPLHGERSIASGASLATVDIGLIADRTGQMLRNELLQQMHPRGATVPARFALAVTLAESLQDLAIRKDETATRANLILTARFVVTSRTDGQTLLSTSVQSVNSYNILTSDFATLSAREDARRRAVQQLASGITQRLSVWLVQTGGRAPVVREDR